MTTPARRQYLQIKAQHQDAILLFQIGDFYETFDDDAQLVARELQIVLTSRAYGPGERVPLAGVPVHALETYAARLIAKGYKVAICEQVSEPGRRLVDRAVTRILTPGTLSEPGLVPPRQNNYLAAVALSRDGKSAGLAYADVTTGEFAVTSFPGGSVPIALEAELHRLRLVECLIAEPFHLGTEPARQEPPQPAGDGQPAQSQSAPFALPRQAALTTLPAGAFDPEAAAQRLCRHFGVQTLEAYGCADQPLAVAAAGAILAYLEKMNPALSRLLIGLRTYATDTYMILDAHTQRNLELLEGVRGGTKGALLAVIDQTRTAMGGRLMRRVLTQPLIDLVELNRRYDALEELIDRPSLRARLGSLLDGLGDLERLAGRVRQGTAVPRELLALRELLLVVPHLQTALRSTTANLLQEVCEALDDCPELTALIERAVATGEENEGRTIKRGYSADLDTLIDSISESRRWIAGLEAAERERTGIKSLKVGYNKVFGYYLEVSHANSSRVPADYLRKQTLVNGERYITPELKDHESRILNAEERIEELERTLFADLLRQAGVSYSRLSATASALARLDVLLGLADVAARNGYTRPELDTTTDLVITAGRHPVVEQMLGSGEFIPNDAAMGNECGSIFLLTGPNMAGKSTFLRQVALICLMAQIGSFVPARQARIGLVDRIFTRVGAHDDIASGQSTFMVEMVETANILHHASRHSLIVLDEIGRGTSTYDGLAIARAVVEHLHERIGARTLFATHYHELASLITLLPSLRAYTMAINEQEEEIVFLHRILPGSGGRSYGIQVARLAGMPANIIQRAREVLTQIEQKPEGQTEPVARLALVAEQGAGYAPDEVLAKRPTELPAASNNHHAPAGIALDSHAGAFFQELLSLNVAAITPLEAMNRLFALQQKAQTLMQSQMSRSNNSH
ncbi:MAG TPA: DNA mismatch repair protein MutS [Ktedonobacterales bacterium]|nr:DNA mismatch repair protein MutS [Ktedonobacterales bacterium]